VAVKIPGTIGSCAKRKKAEGGDSGRDGETGSKLEAARGLLGREKTLCHEGAEENLNGTLSSSTGGGESSV